MDGYKYHVVCSFTDNGETFYVVKYYGKYQQWWHYEIWDSDTMTWRRSKGYKIVGNKTEQSIKE